MNLGRLVNPTERQREFLRAIRDHDFVLYGGEGGGGKSYILRWWLVLFLISCWKQLGLRGVRVGIFCETFKTLQDRQVSKMQAEFPPGLGSFRRDPALDFVLREQYGGGHLCIRNLSKPEEYSSAEFAAIAVDELTKNSLSVFNDLRWRLRWPGVERPKFGAGTNPGGIGHAWVKKYWVEKKFPLELEALADQFVLVKAKASDNPYLSPNYHESLLTLPPEMARRVGHGDWNVYAGQYFPFFDSATHVIRHAEALERIQPWHKRSISGDWGYGHPHCFHWHAKDEHNLVITHDELWDRLVNETEVGRRITEREGQYQRLAPLSAFTFVWDAGKLSPRSERNNPKSIGQLLQEGLGPRIPRPHPADSSPGTRVIRSRLMSQMLGHPGDLERRIAPQRPQWLISDRCEKLIESIPTMVQDLDREKPEEMAKLDWNESQIGDDPVDSAGAGLQWMVGTPVKPDKVKLEEELASVRRRFANRLEEPAEAEAPLKGDFFSQYKVKRGR